MTDSLFVRGLIIGVGGLVLAAQSGALGQTEVATIAAVCLGLSLTLVSWSALSDLRSLAAARGEPT